jgi:hypothetical protein
MIRGLLTVLLLGSLPGLALAQGMDLKPEQPRGNIGDILTFGVTVRLPQGEELLDFAPHTLLPPPEGVRIVSADTLRRSRDGEFRGKVRLAFYRIGRQPVPTFALLYRPAPGTPPDTLVHAPLSIEIVPLLPAGNPALKDIRPLIPLGGPVWGPAVLLLGIVAAGLFWLSRRNRRSGSARPRVHAAPIPAGPFDAALARLDELERASIASGDGVVPLYGDVAELLRATLVEVGALPHRGLTTPEVPGRLPRRLATGDLGRRCEGLLRDADLVKFAKVRPDRAAATSHVTGARQLLEAWRGAAGSADAIR